MKKFLLTLAVALTALFATAQTTSYTDNLVVTIDGESTDPQETTIYVENNADGTFNLSLNQFVLGEEIPVGNIVVENITATGNKVKTFAVSQNITIAAGDENVDDWLGPMLGEVPVELSGKMTDEKLYCTIDIDMSELLGQIIKVTFGSDFNEEEGEEEGKEVVSTRTYNHSAAHLLQNALRRVLGNHVEQAGSYVSDTVCRFDFTHFAALTPAEIAEVEGLVNLEIMNAEEGSMQEMPIAEAKALGAMALFGEKYGSTVRVVRMGSSSIELCGGTHVDNTGKIGLFKIVSESSVAAGVRRIEAVTGSGVLSLIGAKDKLIASAAAELKVQNPADLAKRAAALQGEISSMKKEIESLNSKLAASKLDGIVGAAVAVGGVKLAAVKLDGMQINVARSLADEIKAKYADMVAVIAVVEGGKLNFIAVAGKDAVQQGAHAGKLVAEVAKMTGGKGGGRPDNAMAGGADLSKVDAALGIAEATLSGMLK